MQLKHKEIELKDEKIALTEMVELLIAKDSFMEDSWGKYRITIHPFTTTNTFHRGGFFIHGGKTPGSLGCIDLTSNIEAFVSSLRKEGAIRKCQIHLTVEYPKQ